MMNMIQRLVGIAVKNKKNGRIRQNRAIAEALLPSSADAGLLPDIELVLASLN